MNDEILYKIGNCDKIIELKTTPARLFVLLSHLQLALRVEGNNGASWGVAFEMAKHLEKIICDAVPEAQEVIDRGWNPSYDVTREYFEQEF